MLYYDKYEYVSSSSFCVCLVHFHYSQKIRKIEIYSHTYFLLAVHFRFSPLPSLFRLNLFNKIEKWRQKKRAKEKNVNVRTRNLNAISCTREWGIKYDEMKLLGKNGNLFNKQVMRYDVAQRVMVARACVRVYFDYYSNVHLFSKNSEQFLGWQSSRGKQLAIHKSDAQLYSGWCVQKKIIIETRWLINNSTFTAQQRNKTVTEAN